MTLPALAALRARWPGTHIELIGYPRIANLALRGGLVDRVVSLDKADIARLFAPEVPLPEPSACYFRSFDVVISYLYDPDDAVRNSLERAGAKMVLCANPLVRTENAALHFMRVLSALAIYPDERAYPRLVVSDPLKTVARTRLPADVGCGAVAIHPGSGSRDKNWPLRGFLECAGRLVERGWKPVFVLGEADEEIRATLADGGAKVTALPPGDLVTLAGMLACCRGFLGNDSGVAHIAAAVGTPTVVLFGPSNPHLWASQAPHVRVVRAAAGTTEGLATLGTAQVMESLATALA